MNKISKLFAIILFTALMPVKAMSCAFNNLPFGTPSSYIIDIFNIDLEENMEAAEVEPEGAAEFMADGHLACDELPTGSQITFYFMNNLLVKIHIVGENAGNHLLEFAKLEFGDSPDSSEINVDQLYWDNNSNHLVTYLSYTQHGQNLEQVDISSKKYSHLIAEDIVE